MEPVKNEYLVTLTVPADQVPKVAQELTKRYGGEVLAVWQYAVKGFWLRAEPAVASRMAQDRRIESCDENAVAHESGTQSTVEAPSPRNPDFSFLNDTHYLWHLNRISHRQRQEDQLPPAARDFNYTYGSDGTGVDIYIIGNGVLPWHQEFYPEGTSITAITDDATAFSQDGPSRVLSFPGANIVADRFPGQSLLGSVDEINPEARVPPRNAIAPLPCGGGLTPYAFANGSGQTHDTACASAAAGRIVGVAKGANIIPVRIFTCAGKDTAGSMISGLDWTAKNVRDRARPAVVSMSAFFHLDPHTAPPAFVTLGKPLEILNNAITALTNEGVPVVVSANNQHSNACDTAPANLSIRAGGHVISVGGLSRNSDTPWVHAGDENNPGSNFGRCVDIWAPAEEIPLATMVIGSTTDGFAYRTIDASGTSFSAPIVAGIIARLMSENSTLYADPTKTVRKTYELLTSSATRITDPSFLNGIADSPTLIAYIGGVQITTQPSSVTFTNATNESHTLSVSVYGAGASTTYQWYEGNPGDVGAPRGAQTSSNTMTVTAADVPVGTSKSYWVRVTQPCRDDAARQCSADSIAATAKHECSLDVRVDAEFLTGIRHSTNTDVEPITPPQTVEIVARVAGTGPYHYTATAQNGDRVACGDTRAATTEENDDPNGGAQSIIRIPVPSTVATTYTVTFTTDGVTCGPIINGSTCGSKTVNVSVCDQPVIKARSTPVVWKLEGANFPHTIMLDEANTTSSDRATFQWFRGTYTSFTPVYNANDAQTLERDERPQFIPLDDGQYWGRVDGRCGWAVSRPISVISCYPYYGDLVINAPTLPVAKGRPLVLGAKLVKNSAFFDGANYSWSNPPAAPFSSGTDKRSIIVFPNAASTTYHLEVSSNSTTECPTPSKNITITTSDCHLIADNGQPRSQNAGVNGATLSVILENGVQNAHYQWFEDPSLWTWSSSNLQPQAFNDSDHPTFRGYGGHRYFVRVTATCPTDPTGTQIVEDSNFATLTSRHRAVGPVVKSQQNEDPQPKVETYIRLATINATTVLSVPTEVPGARYEWRAGDQFDDSGDPLATGATYRVTGSGVYWVRTIPLTGDSSDSAVIRLVWNPPVPVAVSPGTVIGTISTLHLTAQFPNPPNEIAYEWRQAVITDDATFIEDLTTPVLNNTNNPELVRTGLVGPATFWVRVLVGNAEYRSDPILIVVDCVRPPTVVALVNPPDPHIANGAQTTLFGAGSGTDLTYQWFRGPLGDTSTQVSFWPTYSGVFNTGGKYWVRATDGCGQTADAGIELFACKPTISGVTMQPAAGVIGPNEHALITVAATPAQQGQELVYQWYAGNTVFPIDHATNATYVADHAGTYFASVSAMCGDGALSGVLSTSVDVISCVPPTIDPLISRDVDRAQLNNLQVNATGSALTYQWYIGAADDASHPIANGTTAAILVQPSDTTDYWVRVTDHGVGACSAKSNVARLTVCAPPVINTQPAGSSVFSGASVTLTVAAAATSQAPLHYAWIEVDVDGNLIPVSGNDSPSFTTPPLTASKTWFVRVFSGSLLNVYTDSARATIHVCDMSEVHWTSFARPLHVGETFTLSIMEPPAGSDLYWYRGMSGDVAHSSLIASMPDHIYYYYQLPPATATASYWVRVQQGACYSDSSTLTLPVCVPTITQQPAGAAITAGGSTSLSVTATPTDVTYQWFVGESGDDTHPVANGTGPSCPVSPSVDTRYWVRVSGSCGATVDSDSALVTVCQLPHINVNPIGTNIARGTSTTLSVSATGSNLTYQWYAGTGTSNPLQTTAFITVAPTITTTYWVRVTGACGTAQNSDAAIVHVCTPPAITAQPQSVTIFAGATATLSVAASEDGVEQMLYQWFRGAAGDVSAPITDATSATFVTPPLTQNTSYWVRVSCGVCNPTASAAATVSICNYPQILSAPADQFIAIGQTATLSAAVGSGSTYQWYVGASGNTAVPAPGPSNLSSYSTAPNVTTQYWAQITNGGCISRTQSANVFVCVPTITQQPASIMINSGTSTALTVAANTPGLSYQWYRGNTGDISAPVGTNSATFNTPALTATTNYWVRVTGSCSRSTDSVTATVTICAPPSIASVTPTQSIVRGSNTTCVVSASGSNLTYQWYVGASGNTTSPISGATSSMITVAPQDTTSYWVRVSGSCGTPLNSAAMLVNVCASPAITAQPQGSIIFSGSTATMSVTATEGTSTPMTYQWYRGASGDVSAPVGTNSATFTTPALTAQTSYWVRVSCGICNPANSQAATISICNYPQLLVSPGDFYNTVGQSVRLYTSNGSGNTYQWYTGASGDTSHPYASNLYYADVAPTVTTQYWAQITNGGCISRTQTANVFVCIPTFTQQPASITIAPGSSTTLSASANTAGVTYQWYVGASGNTAAPIGGATGPSVTVTPSSDTSYWVRAISNCGRTTDSATANVVLCSPPVITAQPMASTGYPGSTASMWVSATGSNLTYQWYYGNSGDTTTPVSGATSATSSMWVGATQKIWVRITGQCGTVNSNSTFASVYPSISQQPPSSLVVGYDTTATISLSASGSYLSYVWKNSQTGAVIATTTTPTLITPSITANTYIYCQVWSGNAVVNSYETLLNVCYNQPNVTIVKAPNGSCSIAYTNYNGADDYQWYQGARGDTSHLVSSGSTALYVCPSVATQYWLRAVIWSSPQVVSCYTDSNAVTLP